MPRKSATDHEHLSRRERQMMDIVWSRQSATAADVHAALAEAPSYSAVRALLAVLVQKGHLRTRAEGRRYIYEPTAPRERARTGALKRVLRTFFDNSTPSLVAFLLDPKDHKLTAAELSEIRALLDARDNPPKRK